MTSKPAEFIGIPEAANLLSLNHKSVRKLISNGDLPAFRLAGHPRMLRVKRADIDALLQPVPAAR